MRIAIVTDAWKPQVNGVVRTLCSVSAEIERLGHRIALISPDRFRSLACPTYPEIRLAIATPAQIGRRIEAAGADAVHIATEGPLGLAARSWCIGRTMPFTTAYHTQFPEYLAKRTRLPAACFWPYIRWFHGPSQAILVATPSVAQQLASHGLPRTRMWTRGVDTQCFKPGVDPHPRMSGLPRPILLHVGRVAIEKNIQAFLDSRHSGTRIVVGDGPDLARLKRRYPQACFLGALHGEELASAYATADVLVFPSRTDTFGLVMIEALACGTPVAAYPVAGPLDVLDTAAGCMDADLDRAIAGALLCQRRTSANYATRFSWKDSAAQFLSALVPLQPLKPGPSVTRPHFLGSLELQK